MSASTVRVASVAVVHDRSVLILRRVLTDLVWAGCWDLPGGRLEGGETPLEGALRELREETGLDIETAEPLQEGNPLEDRPAGTTLQTYPWPERRVWETVFFSRVSERPSVRVDPAEHTEYRWVGLADLPRLEFTPGRLTAVRRALNKG
ncbi:MAG: NUDIX domain-containing protein [Euryarchaeota archaeon]|nr:NUDIX domain-containing protein [Euryarchaeota archaeon]MDE1836958.1 NUDIX domain-containing protein [Euryarchaeota archaeon]MDE1881932.1 NUDIX domain-containing protein [Euryarchaeota archaeon]MDE2045857.1 NUDIX domain-containing protein [Thermoplasmata archaeon]